MPLLPEAEAPAATDAPPAEALLGVDRRNPAASDVSTDALPTGSDAKASNFITLCASFTNLGGWSVREDEDEDEEEALTAAAHAA